MDLSKLPKLSETPRPPSNEPPKEDTTRPAYEPADVTSVEAGAVAMLWFSIIMGVLCMLIGKNFVLYGFAKLTGREYHTGAKWMVGEKAGQEVAYWDLAGAEAWTNAGMFLFGLALIMEGVALALVSGDRRGKKIVLSLSLGAIAVATVVNLVTAGKVLGIGGIPLMSGLAVAFGGYMAMYQWKMLRVISSGRAAPMT